ncbi:MAG: lysoplasmalogenase [Deltaproteobacteria bacterium]|nr:lysoplasmalogenase [Deltaproteobacteria bacterium]MBW2651191.1 lysoplasmalogenase [Deltaproteobacteria bacterium]
MGNIIIIVTAALLLVVLLYHIKEDNQKSALLTKTVLSSLFVVTVLVQPHLISGYYNFLLAGLIFCLLGDVFLALPQKGMFLAGLVVFLAGHVLYVFGFLRVTEIGQWAGIGSLVIIAVGGLVYFLLRTYLGRMKIPVIFYMIVISVMLAGAWAVFGDCGLAGSGRIMIFAGALLFYLSDLFVARHRFVKEEFSNRLIGLPMYYAGQFLLAFSVGFLERL